MVDVTNELLTRGGTKRTIAIIPGPEAADTSPGQQALLRVSGYVVLMGASTYTVRPLDESTWPAFAALVERNNGIFGGCWCMGFHPEGVGKDTTAELNRDRKLARVRAGTAHAALVFHGGDCLGWCQFGPPGELPRIKSRAAYEKGQAAPPDWRIACCYVRKGHRRQGGAAALAGALDLIAALAGGTVEGYPENADSVPAGSCTRWPRPGPSSTDAGSPDGHGIQVAGNSR